MIKKVSNIYELIEIVRSKTQAVKEHLVSSIDFSDIDISELQVLDNMFYGGYVVAQDVSTKNMILDVSNLKVEHIVSAKQMFYGFEGKILGLEDLKFNSLKDASNMFYGILPSRKLNDEIAKFLLNNEKNFIKNKTNLQALTPFWVDNLSIRENIKRFAPDVLREFEELNLSDEKKEINETLIEISNGTFDLEILSKFNELKIKSPKALEYYQKILKDEFGGQLKNLDETNEALEIVENMIEFDIFLEQLNKMDKKDSKFNINDFIGYLEENRYDLEIEIDFKLINELVKNENLNQVIEDNFSNFIEEQNNQNTYEINGIGD